MRVEGEGSVRRVREGCGEIEKDRGEGGRNGELLINGYKVSLSKVHKL